MERLVWRQVTIPKGLSGLLELICKETIRHDPECIHSFIAELLEKEYEEQIGSQQRKPNEGESEETHLLGKDGNNQENTSPVTPVSSLEFSQERSGVTSPSEVPANEVSVTPTKIIAQAEQVPKSPEKVEEQSKPKSPISSPATTITEIEGSQPSNKQEENEIEKLLERSLDTKDIQDLLESGDFQNVSVTEEDEESDGDADEEEEEESEDEQPLVVIDTKKVVETVESEGEDEYEEEEEEEEEEEQEDESDEEEKIKRNLEALMTEDVEASKSDSELNDAAIKIQAGFRGYQTRKNLRKDVKVDSDDETPQVDQIRSVPTSPIRSAPLDANESLEEDDIVPVPVPRPRRAGSDRNRDSRSAKYRSGMVFNQPEDPEQILGYDDDYLNKAATRIQANVRGWMTRKDLEKRHDVTNDKKKAAVKIQATVRGFLTRRRLAKAKLANRRYNVRKGKGKRSSKRSESEKSTPASPAKTTTMTPPPTPLAVVAPTPIDTSAPSILASQEQDDE